jgi:tRNA modification GTPase
VPLPEQDPVPVGRLLPGGGDTIVALATATGRGALATIRMSGPDVAAIGRAILSAWPSRPRQAALVTITDPTTGAVLDRGVVVRYEAPRSYTGEDLVEITTHGGVVVPGTVLAALIAHGARQATAGEFTRRAVLNGKLDLVQAEAVADLIDARSRRGQQIALSQIEGSLSRRVLSLRELLLNLEAMIAYDIDFPEEDDGPIPVAAVTTACAEAIGQLRQLRGTAAVGELVREGAVVVLAGAPNVGKSSLFNALLGQPRAIVTAHPGTTRDALEAVMDIAGWGVRLVDTAGLRETTDQVERMGIEMSDRYVAKAEIVLACGDSVATLSKALSSVGPKTNATLIPVRTKADQEPPQVLRAELVAAGYEIATASQPVIVSADTGEGLEMLAQTIAQTLEQRHGRLELDAPILLRERHRRIVALALEELESFQQAWVAGDPPPSVAATHLRAAVAALEDIVGAVSIEDVLDRVFSTFCVGK